MGAARRIKVIAGRVVRDIERKMDNAQRGKYADELAISCYVPNYAISY
jgi:hypothetical protein